MKTDACAFSASQRALVGSALLCVSVFATQAFGTDSPISVLSKAPLSLPRLTPEAGKLGKKPMFGEAFEVLGLQATEHAKQKERRGAAYLEIEPSAGWQRHLRRQGVGASYVTFTLNASVGTMIDIGDASVSVEPSQKDGSYAAISSGSTTKPINYEVPLMLFDGARMATLDIVTVKLNRKAHTWAMWVRDSLVAEDMPLVNQSNSESQIRIVAGPRGAWLCGLVCSDENPLFEDANDNGVPDDFEQKIIGKLLDENASAQTLANLRLAWQEERLSMPPSEFVLTTPLPDSFPEWCAPDGAPVHGMVGGLKFSAKKN